MESHNYAGGNVEHIKVGADHTKDVQAYLDYYNIVGDDDGGKMMTEKEFEAYKKKNKKNNFKFQSIILLIHLLIIPIE